jgi:hypothetical protein
MGGRGANPNRSQTMQRPICRHPDYRFTPSSSLAAERPNASDDRSWNDPERDLLMRAAPGRSA